MSKTNSGLNGVKEGLSPFFSDAEGGSDNSADAIAATSTDNVPFSYLETGRRFDLSYEPQTGVGVDGGDPMARLYSPFILQYLPPADAQHVIPDMSKKKNREEALTSFGNAIKKTYGSDNFTHQYTFENYQNSLVALSEEATFANVGGDETRSSFVGSGQTLSYVSQLHTLIALPPLQFLINPNSMNITYTKIQDFSSRTRKNRVFKAWGEDQPKISFSATTGGFIAMAQSQPTNMFSIFNMSDDPQAPSGLQYASKRQSKAFQNFLKILSMYQNAALLYDTLHDTEAHLGVGSFMIHFDQMTYEGMIENFDFSYQEESPNRLEFNFDFTVSQMWDWHTETGQPKPINPPNDSKRWDISPFGGTYTVRK